MTTRLSPVGKLILNFKNLTMAEYVLRAERQDNSDGIKTIFELFLGIRSLDVSLEQFSLCILMDSPRYKCNPLYILKSHRSKF